MMLNHPQGWRNNIKKLINKKAKKVQTVEVKNDQKLFFSGCFLGTTFSNVVLIISNCFFILDITHYFDRVPKPLP